VTVGRRRDATNEQAGVTEKQSIDAADSSSQQKPAAANQPTNKSAKGR